MSKSDKALDVSAFSSAAASLNFLQNHVKSELLAKISTGDPIKDTIVAFIILSAQDSILSSISSLKDVVFSAPKALYNFIRLIAAYWKNRRSPKMHKTAVIKYITENREINTLYDPIMWYINSITDTKKENQLALETTKTKTEVTLQIPKNRTAKINFIDHEIEYTISSEMITIYAEKEHKRENTVITLSTFTPQNRGMDIFQQFAEMCQKQYSEFTKKKKWEQMIYRNEKGAWKEQKSKSSRKIETVILKQGQMTEIINDINEFVQKEEWYVSRDVPYTRRYMFWGKPGTGKSSCIKAIACHTKRHIHYLVLSNVASDEELFKLIEGINFQETVLVIEDIDCASEITRDRSKESPTQDAKDTNGKEEREHRDIDDIDILSKNSKAKEKNKLSLAGLLNAIDGGMIQNHGQIMITTTNHPEFLDEALVRPGRVDRKFEFGYCDNLQIEGLFVNFFERKPLRKFNFPEEKITPAEVTSILLQYKKDPDNAWEKLIEKFGQLKVQN